MRRQLTLVVILATLTLTACGGSPDNGRRPEAADSGTSSTEPSPPPEPEVLSGEDMESFAEDREEAIQRDTPLGEEHDDAGDLRRRFEDDP